MTVMTPSIRQRVKQLGAPLYHGIQQRLPLRLRRYFVHAVRHRRLLRLGHPRTFNEKLSWRMVHDRRDLLRATCDKKAMKELARERAGDLLRVPETIWEGCDITELDDIQLPDHWVLKPNHRSGGLVHFGHGPAQCAELIDITKGWLDEFNWRVMGEWAYSQAEPTLLVEEFIGTPGQVPVDYKFEVFDGEVQVVWVYFDRFSDFRGLLVDRYFRPVEVTGQSGQLRRGEAVDRPVHFERMVDIAQKIAQGFDYLRVDLYDTGDDVWFGETTPYSANGVEVFKPKSYDRILGSYWTLPSLGG